MIDFDFKSGEWVRFKYEYEEGEEPESQYKYIPAGTEARILDLDEDWTEFDIDGWGTIVYIGTMGRAEILERIAKKG